MKRTILFALIGSLLTVNSFFAQDIVLNDQWKFQIGDNTEWSLPAFNDTDWKVISSVTAWENQGYPDTDGFGWYRKSVEVPNNLKNQVRKFGGMILTMDNIDDADEVYFNGTRIGGSGTFPPQYTGMYGVKRKYQIPANLIIFGKQNLIAVRVYDAGGGGGILSAKSILRPKYATDAIQHTYTIPGKDWVLSSADNQRILMNMKNTMNEKAKFNVLFVLRTDQYKLIDSLSYPITLNPGRMLTTSIDFKLPAPGFYRCALYMQAEGTTPANPERFNIGFEPEKINAPRDAKADFDEFWNQSLADLAKVDPDYKLTLLTDKSTAEKDVYHVQMMSYMQTRIEGFYAVPRGEGKYPAIVTFMGYGSDNYMPNPAEFPGFAHFVLSVRGQGVQKAKSTYGSWDTWGLASKETYYYRGAFLDLVRAIDFVSSRPEVDAGKIAAEGGSQGGAFTFAACALDPRIKAAAPTIPFLSDYRNYFKIVPWPRSDFEAYLAKNTDSNWEKIYDVLSYFDIKNLATRIQCPLYMAVGLQDEVCPPFINFAAYNQVPSEKKYRIYPDQGHSTPAEWRDERMKFFREKLGISE